MSLVYKNMHATPSKARREREILSKVINKSGAGSGGKIGPFDPYQKTMVPVPPYITTGSPTPSDSTSINYSRKENGDAKARAATGEIEQFDRAPVKKDYVNKEVGFIGDEKRLSKLKGYKK